ncbi:DUF4113 domain-containing protein [Mesorhizobium liriopis]|uniref:DUF4113 domain-containing protein n=1 Tax=Mesorhizobium liriopis TaxID=2953882 RepID=UPI00338F3121
MTTIDACNQRFECGHRRAATAGIQDKRKRATKFEMRSPLYTTRMDELPTVQA